MITFIISLAAKEGNIKRILCFDCLPKRARRAHLSRLGLLALIHIKKKHCMERTYKVRNSWKKSAMGTRKAADDKINEQGKYTESVNNSRGLIVLVGTSQLAFFPGSRDKKVILDS